MEQWDGGGLTRWGWSGRLRAMNPRTLLVPLALGLVLLVGAGVAAFHLASRSRDEAARARQAEAIQARVAALAQEQATRPLQAPVPTALQPRPEATVREIPMPLPNAASVARLRPGDRVTVFMRRDVLGNASTGLRAPFSEREPSVEATLVLIGDHYIVVSHSGEEYWIPWSSIVGVKAGGRATPDPADAILEEPAR